MEHSIRDVCGCKICNGRTELLFNLTVMGKNPAQLLKCQECGFSAFYNPTWIVESYADSLTTRDCGAVRRCVLMAARFSLFGLIAARRRVKWLDFGGNTGLLSRLLRDYGLDAGSIDKYEQNIFSRGFIPQSPDVVSLVEVIEHLEDPVGSIGEIVSSLNPNYIFIATQLIPETGLDPSWWYLQLDTGQHISFFTIRALKVLAAKSGYQLVNCGSVFIMYRQTALRSVACFIYRILLAAGVPYFLNGLYPLVSRKWINKDFQSASGKAE
jgi:hypothetical protein